MTMHYPPRFQPKTEASLPSDLTQLGRKIDELPDDLQGRMRPLFERVLEGHRLRAGIMNVAKEALERIRLEVQMLQFDLDCTRREKEELRRQLSGE